MVAMENNNLNLPLHHSTRFGKKPSHAGVKLFNMLPIDLKDCTLQLLKKLIVAFRSIYIQPGSINKILQIQLHKISFTSWIYVIIKLYQKYYINLNLSDANSVFDEQENKGDKKMANAIQPSAPSFLHIYRPIFIFYW